MPAKDLYHDNVRHALVKDGWTITHDPYTLTFGQKSVFVDLGAERILAGKYQRCRAWADPPRTRLSSRGGPE